MNIIIDNCDSKARRCEELLGNERAYINATSAWKQLEEDARKEVADNPNSVFVQHKLISTAQSY